MPIPMLLSLALLAAAQTSPPADPAPEDAPVVEAGVPVLEARVVNRFPHDVHAFTEGLSWCDGTLYESTGETGASDIRRVDLATGTVRARVAIAPELFGEGTACWGKQLISLTWQTGLGFRWDRATLKRTASFTYPGEGWGMTTNGNQLILSDGTPTLRVLDAATFAQRSTIKVTLNGKPQRQLNELEYVRGNILANIWMSGFIARIDPATGKINALIDLRPLIAEVNLADRDSVANGIAYDAAHDRLFVTGKNWPRLFEITLGDEVGRVQ